MLNGQDDRPITHYIYLYARLDQRRFDVMTFDAHARTHARAHTRTRTHTHTHTHSTDQFNYVEIVDVIRSWEMQMLACPENM